MQSLNRNQLFKLEAWVQNMLDSEIEADKFIVSGNYWLEIWKKINVGSSEVPGQPELIWSSEHANILKNSPILRAGVLVVISTFSPGFLHSMPFPWYFLGIYNPSLMNNEMDFFVISIQKAASQALYSEHVS